MDKCRRHLRENEIKEEMNAYDLIEREIKIKEFILGNANFVAELINIQFLSKKILFQYIDNLLLKFYMEKSEKFLKMIYLEAIVILLDKFGTLLKVKEKKNKRRRQKRI